MSKTRSIERALFISAAPDQVWQAFTEGGHIRNWFAPVADSAPGVGGFIDLQWDPSQPGGQHCVITEWEQNRRLLMSWRDAPDGEHPLPIELVLEAKDGGTLLRLTHSGFLSDASWDDEYESHGRGWTYELRSLRHYVEQHFGQGRSFVMRRYPLQTDYLPQWQSVVGEAGLFHVAGSLAEAAECVIGLPTGERSRARILHALTDKDFGVVLEVLGGGVLRFAFETFSGVPEIWFWAFSWQHNEAELTGLVEPWFLALTEKLGEPAGAAPAING